MSSTPESHNGPQGRSPERGALITPGDSRTSLQITADRRSSHVSRFLNRTSIAAIPVIVIAASMLYVAATYDLPSVVRPQVEWALWSALGVSTVAAVMFAIRPLRRWTGLLAILALTAAVGVNTYGLVTPRKAGVGTTLELRWSRRRTDNSLTALANSGNAFSRVTYAGHLAMREWLKGRKIVSYDEPVLTRRYLESVCYVREYAIETYPHTLKEAAYQDLLLTPHRKFRFNHRKRNEFLFIIPEWASKAKILYLLSSPEQYVHVLVPGNKIREMAE